jgi:signal transduction histidine kinase
MESLLTAYRGIPLRFTLVAVAVGLIFVLGMAETSWVPFAGSNNAEASDFTQALIALLIVPSALGPLVSLRWPIRGAALSVLLFPFALTSSGHWPWILWVLLMGCAFVASWSSARHGVLIALAALVPVVVTIAGVGAMLMPYGAINRFDQNPANGLGYFALTSGLYALATALVVGAAFWARRSALRESERRQLAARAEDVEERSAVVEERARLARDLHDVVAHHVSLIAVRAETAPYTHPDLGEPARGVLGDIAADARLALDELRGVLGILGRAGSAERAPQPTWADIAALVERTRSAGVEIDLVGDVTAEVGPASGYAAYRVVQEALTNARKHAPGARVTVDLDATSQLLTVLVSTPLSASRTAPEGGGHGLAGMRERVDALGGRLLSGPVGDDFVVEAILPRGLAQGAA